MDCDPTEFFAHHLTLSSVNARANVNAEFPHRVHNCSSAADRARRTIKRCQEAIAGCINFATSMPRELITNKGVMLSEEVFPPSVAEFDKPISRRDDVRELYGGGDPAILGFSVAALPGQESFSLSED